MDLGNFIIIQDYEDVRNFDSYRAIICVMPDRCPVLLDASNGTVAAIFYTNLFFIKELTMSTSNQLSVYNNFATDVNKLADYSYSNIMGRIPQKFSGKFTTFVLDKDVVIMQFVSTASAAGWSSAVNGRRGFFASPNFGLNATNQNFADQVCSSNMLKISYTVEKDGIVGQSELTLTITSKNKVQLFKLAKSSSSCSRRLHLCKI